MYQLVQKEVVVGERVHIPQGAIAVRIEALPPEYGHTRYRLTYLAPVHSGGGQ